MQSCISRPQLGRVGRRAATHRLGTQWGRRSYQPSDLQLKDEPRPGQHNRIRRVSEAVETASRAAEDVQALFNTTQTKYHPKARAASQQHGAPKAQNSTQIKAHQIGASGSQDMPRRERASRRTRSTDSAAPTDRSSGVPSQSSIRSMTLHGDKHATKKGVPSANRQHRSQIEAEQEDLTDETQSMNIEGQGKTYSERMLEEFEKPKDWTPSAETIESLRPYLPRIPIGTEGKLQALDSRLLSTTDPLSIQESSRVRDLARRLLDGHYVRFRSVAEKDAVVTEAKVQAERDAESKSETLGEVVEPLKPKFEPLGQKSRKAMEHRVLEGRYSSPNQSTRNPVLDQVTRLVRLNHSYSQVDEASLLKKLSELLPAPQATMTKTKKKSA